MPVPPRIYLDHAATTPLLPQAAVAMREAEAAWANPSSPHAEGRRARALLEDARGRIAAALDWPHAVLFTSGASEAIATVFARAAADARSISAVEHDAVRRVVGDARVLPVDADGGVVYGDGRGLVAIQVVNSETGVVQDVAAIGAAIRAAGGLWLCDATQAAGKIALPDADFIALSAHKFGGPPGIGTLLVRDLATLAPSGGQERGYRGGTENLPGACGMATALEAGSGWLAGAQALRDTLDTAIEAAGGIVIAGRARRLATIASYRMPGVAAAAQMIRLDLAGIAVSAGSACSSGSLRQSPVLAAMGMDERAAGETIRVSFGRTTTAAEVARFADAWRTIAAASVRHAA